MQNLEVFGNEHFGQSSVFGEEDEEPLLPAEEGVTGRELGAATGVGVAAVGESDEGNLCPQFLQNFEVFGVPHFGQISPPFVEDEDAEDDEEEAAEDTKEGTEGDVEGDAEGDSVSFLCPQLVQNLVAIGVPHFGHVLSGAGGRLGAPVGDLLMIGGSVAEGGELLVNTGAEAALEGAGGRSTLGLFLATIGFGLLTRTGPEISICFLGGSSSSIGTDGVDTAGEEEESEAPGLDQNPVFVGRGCDGGCLVSSPVFLCGAQKVPDPTADCLLSNLSFSSCSLSFCSISFSFLLCSASLHKSHFNEKNRKQRKKEKRRKGSNLERGRSEEEEGRQCTFH